MDAFVEWEKCKAGTWCILLQLDLEHKHFDEMEGVYVIWYGDPNPVALRVGYGYIRNCLANERNDKDVLAYHMQVAEERLQEGMAIYTTWLEVNFLKNVDQTVDQKGNGESQ
jgi:hypothetical protein